MTLECIIISTCTLVVFIVMIHSIRKLEMAVIEKKNPHEPQRGQPVCTFDDTIHTRQRETN